MSWITIVWSMNAAACLTLAAFYLAVWCKQRENWVYLLFSCSAIAAAAISAFELWMMHCQTVDQYEAAGALDTCARVGAHALIRCFRAALSACRTSMAGVEHLRSANAGIDPQFQFSRQYQFSGNHRPSPVLVMAVRWCRCPSVSQIHGALLVS